MKTDYVGAYLGVVHFWAGVGGHFYFVLFDQTSPSGQNESGILKLLYT